MKDDEEKKKKKREWWEEFLYNVMMQTAKEMMQLTAQETIYEELEKICDEELTIDIIL